MQTKLDNDIKYERYHDTRYMKKDMWLQWYKITTPCRQTWGTRGYLYVPHWIERDDYENNERCPCSYHGIHPEVTRAICQRNSMYNNHFSDHKIDIIMSAMVSQITGVSIVYSIVCSGADQRMHQSSASLPLCGEFVGGRWIPHTKDH